MELFSAQELAPADRGGKARVYRVSELNRAVRLLLEENLGRVWVEGEVCNYRRQASGHQYFGLKDDRGQISCVLFSRAIASLRQVALSDGLAVQARGEITLYEARGQFQLVVDLVQPAGVGLLQARFEALKRKLDAEGLFAAARKRPLPKMPRHVALVTSPTGAALHDMLNILQRRAPWVRVLIHPVRVQGEGAGREIAAAVAELNTPALPPVDLIVVCRGGGSAEDLWAFNEEPLARAIFHSAIPVVSAVGHEIDFTIADFVADLRAPTPSAAAELIVPEAAEVGRHLTALGNRLQRHVAAQVEKGRAQLAALAQGALRRGPRQRILEALQHLDYRRMAMSAAMAHRVAEARRRLDEARAALRQHRPDQVLALRRQQLAAAARALQELAKNRVGAWQQRLRASARSLHLLSPQAVLERGYSVTLTAGGHVIRSRDEAIAGTKIVTRVRDGEFDSTVT